MMNELRMTRVDTKKKKKKLYVCVQSSHHVRVEMVFGYAHTQGAHSMRHHQLNALLKEAKQAEGKKKKEKKKEGWHRWPNQPTNLSQAPLPLPQLLSKYATSCPTGARGFPA